MSRGITLSTIVSNTFKLEGFKGFYKGMGSPIVTVPLINSIVYASYEFCKKLMHVTSEQGFTFK